MNRPPLQMIQEAEVCLRAVGRTRAHRTEEHVSLFFGCSPGFLNAMGVQRRGKWERRARGSNGMSGLFGRRSTCRSGGQSEAAQDVFGAACGAHNAADGFTG